MRKKRYLEKLEAFEGEMDFIKTHEVKMSEAVTRRALLYSLQVCVDAIIDGVAMMTKDLGLAVEDDYTNIEKLDLDAVQRGLNKVEELYAVFVKLVEVVEQR
jgi:uncharacterized protein YutE (UPF0331/DUF86 family)